MLRVISICTALSAFTLSAHSSLAQTSTQRFISDPKAAYAQIKDVMRRLDAHFGQRPFLDDDKFNIATCAEAGAYLMETKRKYEDDQLFQTIGFIARNALDWASGLTGLGYPRSVWEGPIAKYEADELAAAIQARTGGRQRLTKFAEGLTDHAEEVQKQLVTALDSYRIAHPSLARVVYEPGCGAGEIFVKIVTEPRGAQVLFVPTFFYELCRAQNLNPDDTTSCNRWREADDGRLSEVSGDYQYVAKWNDGTIRRGKLSFGSNDDGATVTIRKP